MNESELYETIEYLSELLAFVIVTKGPVLIEKQDWEAGLPAEASGVMVEETQEGYLLYITDKTKEELEDGA